MFDFYFQLSHPRESQPPGPDRKGDQNFPESKRERAMVRLNQFILGNVFRKKSPGEYWILAGYWNKTGNALGLFYAPDSLHKMYLLTGIEVQFEDGACSVQRPNVGDTFQFTARSEKSRSFYWHRQDLRDASFGVGISSLEILDKIYMSDDLARGSQNLFEKEIS